MRSRTSSSLSRSIACTASEAMPAARARRRRSRRSKGRPGRAIASAAAPERRRAMGASSRSSGLVGRSSRMKRARRSRSHVLVLGTAKSSRAPDASSCDTAMQPASLSNASTASRVTCRSTCWASCAALNCAASRSKKRNISSSRSTEGTVTGSYVSVRLQPPMMRYLTSALDSAGTAALHTSQHHATTRVRELGVVCPATTIHFTAFCRRTFSITWPTQTGRRFASWRSRQSLDRQHCERPARHWRRSPR